MRYPQKSGLDRLVDQLGSVFDKFFSGRTSTSRPAYQPGESKAEKKCTYCGTMFDTGPDHCPSCGAPAPPGPVYQTGARTAPQKREPSIRSILAMVFAVLAMILAAAWGAGIVLSIASLVLVSRAREKEPRYRILGTVAKWIAVIALIFSGFLLILNIIVRLELL